MGRGALSAILHHGELTSPLDAAGDVGEIEPHFYAAEMRAFGTDRRRNSRPQVARRTDISRELRMHLGQLRDFVA